MRRPLRVLMICPQFRPLMGGYERAAERLSIELARRGHRVTVATERRDASWPAEETLDGVRIRRLACVYKPALHSLTSVSSLGRFLLREGRRFDVVHVHQFGWSAAIAVALAPWLNTPVVVKTASTGGAGGPATLSRLRLARLALWLTRRVEACVATSERAAAEAASLGIPESRIYRIPNGLDVERFKPLGPELKQRLKRSLGVSHSRLVVFVGRLAEAKDPLLLLQAWASLGDRSEEAVLAFVGDGPLRESLESQIAQLGLDKRVRCIGQLDDPLPWYQASDLFVLPSRREGLSNSLLEALACGVPVVSTRVSGSEDVFRDTVVGAMVEVGDAQALGEATIELLGDEARRRSCATAARELAVRRFSITAVTDSIEALYEQLSCRSGSQPHRGR